MLYRLTKGARRERLKALPGVEPLFPRQGFPPRMIEPSRPYSMSGFPSNSMSDAFNRVSLLVMLTLGGTRSVANLMQKCALSVYVFRH